MFDFIFGILQFRSKECGIHFDALVKRSPLQILFALTFCEALAEVLQCEDYAAETQAQALLAQHTEKCVVKSKTARKGAVELNLEIRLKSDNTDFVNALADLRGVQSAVLVSYNGDYMG